MEITLIILGVLLFVGLAILIGILFHRKWNDPAAKEKREQKKRERQEAVYRRVGEDGEQLVRKALGEDVEGERRVLSNYRFTHDGTSTEIDHILIEEHGVFVIETKNWSGEIYGKDDDKTWTQVRSDGEKKLHHNPVKQNRGHIYNLKKLLPHDIPLTPLVVFVKNNVEYIRSDFVVPLEGLGDALEKLPSANLSPKQIESVYQALLTGKSELTAEEHIENVQRWQALINMNICPQCGNRLVPRQGQNGTFIGCSAYPKCKFRKSNS